MVDNCLKCGKPPKIERSKNEWHIWCESEGCDFNFVYVALPKNEAIKIWEDNNKFVYEDDIRIIKQSAALKKKLEDFQAAHPHLK